MKAYLCYCVIIFLLGIGATTPPLESGVNWKIAEPLYGAKGNRKQQFNGEYTLYLKILTKNNDNTILTMCVLMLFMH